VQESGVVHPPREPRDRLDRRPGVDLRKALALGAGVAGPQQVAQLDPPFQADGDEDRRRSPRRRFGEEQRLRRREAGGREGRGGVKALAALERPRARNIRERRLRSRNCLTATGTSPRAVTSEAR
jgi:hypothetical protein